MPNELENFQTTGMSWEERASTCEGLAAVYSPNNQLRSRWLSLVNSSVLQKAIQRSEQGQFALDFGCGIGQLTYKLSFFFSNVMGVDITDAMLKRAESSYPEISFEKIDGVHLPLENNSVDFIWICGVLRYSLLVPNPKHKEIVDELFRVLKPGGWVCNLEMYVDLPSDVFSKDFLERGFNLKVVSVPHVQFSCVDKIATGRFRRFFLRKWWADFSVFITQLTVKESRLKKNHLRDYLFEYRKPSVS